MPAARKSAAPAVERFFQFSLLGLVACAFCALADTGRLDLPSLAFLLAGVFWRGLMAAGLVKINIPQRIITIVATLYLVFYPLDYYFISRDFFAATAHGVCFLGVARILAARTNRDYLYTGALAFVALLGASALSTQIRFFGWLVAAIVFGLGVLTSGEIRRGFQRTTRVVAPVSTRNVWRLALVVACAACGVVLLTSGLFLLIPRTARAAANLFPSGPRVTGFTNSIDLGGFGDIARIAKDTRPVLRIKPYNTTLPPNLKWRGTALADFDGRRWSEHPTRDLIVPAQGTTMVADQLQRSRLDGRRLVYRVDMTDSDNGTLFIAGVPEYINLVVTPGEMPRLARDSEDSFRALPALRTPLGYEVSAQNGAPLPYPLSAGARQTYTRLPRWLDKRIPELAARWVAGDDREPGVPAEVGTDLQSARRIEARLHRDFTYELVRSSNVRDPLADFLFRTKRGYCEYFASAMAVLLRTQKIPARVVTGFQSGYYNDVSATWVMRASDAHAWVEAWIEGHGWMTFDPTPPATEPLTAGFWQHMAMYLDAADSVWQQWVLAYNPGQQIALAFSFRNKLKAMGADGFSGWPSLGAAFSAIPRAWLMTLVAVPVLALLAWFGPSLWRSWMAGHRMRKIRRGEGSVDDAVILYERMVDSLAKRGFQKPAWFTPNEFAKNLPGGEREAVDVFTRTYNEVRFGGNASAMQQLADLLKGIETGPAR